MGMAQDDAARIRHVRERFSRSEFHSRWLGLRLERVEPGEVDVSLALEPKHLNLVGTLHGGLIATLADTATGLAQRTLLEPDAPLMTTQLSVTFLTPARDGRVTARGRVIRSGRRFGYAEADVVNDDGTLLARATATFAVGAGSDQ
jgi:acyl-CoA thioesterase